jgi:hypothetical protein
MRPLDDNLVGYLLDALDEDTRREVDVYLKTHPSARQKLDRLRLALSPLAADREPEEPPPGLVQATLALVDSERNRALPKAPQLARRQAGATSWWRRSELIAASILALVLLGVGSVWIYQSRQQAQIVECQENLEKFYRALVLYSERRSDGAFPRIETTGPRSAAGAFVPILADAGVLPEGVNLTCPSSGQRSAPLQPGQLARLEEAYKQGRADYTELLKELAGSYAYSLGYRDAAGLHGLRRIDDLGHLPILADQPPFTGRGSGGEGNSRNHGSRGQNVLFIDGSVRFVTARTVGPDDDIYLNDHHRVLAGVHSGDSVLGAFDASP